MLSMHLSAIFPSGEWASRVIDADNRQKNVRQGHEAEVSLASCSDGVLRPCPAANDNNYEASGRARARIATLRLGARRRAARINIIAGDHRQNETATTASGDARDSADFRDKF